MKAGREPVRRMPCENQRGKQVEEDMGHVTCEDAF